MLYSFEIHASSSGPRLSSTSVPSRSALSAITLKWELNEPICEREWYSGIHRPVSDWADASESLESCSVARRFEKMAYLSNTIGVFWLGFSLNSSPHSQQCHFDRSGDPAVIPSFIRGSFISIALSCVQCSLTSLDSSSFASWLHAYARHHWFLESSVEVSSSIFFNLRAFTAYLSNTIGVFWLKCRGWSEDSVPDSSCLGLMTAMIALVRSSGYFHSCPPSDSFSSLASPALI